LQFLGYLSRILKTFEDKNLIRRKPSETDGRQMEISLTSHGLKQFERLNEGSRSQLKDMLLALSIEDRRKLVTALNTVKGILLPEQANRNYIMRSHQPGDMGWVVERHGTLYAREYGWNEQFEALVAEIVAKFLQTYDQRYERCFIVELDGERVGCAFVVKESAKVGKLRLLLVEPKARKFGIGTRLVNECIRFSRQVGYKRINFWTNDPLKDARRIYDRLGFTLISTERHNRFGPTMVGQHFEMQL
jgi:GNAT superfamily N-acetyltransferase